MCRLLAILLLLPVAAFAEEAKGTQYAFLVGCSGYSEAKLTPLPYTVRDVIQFREALLETGFEADHIKMLHDKQDRRFMSERVKIVKEFKMLLDGLKPEDTVVVALSGHGVQLKKEGISYFCPLDADLEDKNTLIPLDGKDGLFEQLKACAAKRKLLIVNACRDVRDIPARRAQAAEKIDLEDFAAAPVPEGIAAIYSCKAGQKSYFDPKRQGGIFFEHVTRAWRGEYAGNRTEMTIEDFFREVGTRTKVDVDKTYGESQVPEVKREYKEEWRLAVSVLAAEYREYETLIQATGSADKWYEQHAPGRIREWRRLAEGGIAMAMLLVGDCHMAGTGTEKDEKKAVDWFRRGADRGHRTSINNLALALQNGVGADKDEKQAAALYRKAAELGEPASFVNLGLCHLGGNGTEKNDRLAIEWFRKAASLGHGTGMVFLARCLQTGLGTEKDEKQAVDWCLKAAKLRHPMAMYQLGNCALTGAGTEKDEKQAAGWYLQAAKLGYAPAMFNLGLCHARGIGADKDEKEAFQWFRKGADLQDPPCMREVGYCNQHGIGVKKDEKQAVEWYRKAVGLGDAMAMFNLGYCLANGVGVAKDLKQAAEWYQKAGLLGNQEAVEALKLPGKE